VSTPARIVALAFGLALACVPAASARAGDGVFCDLYGPDRCAPWQLYPPGQDLRLDVRSRAREQALRPDGSIDNIRALFAVLRLCWTPPALERAREGMQVSVRLAFNRAGNIIGTPRFTYISRGASAEQRELYRQSVLDGLTGCTPLPFTAGMGGAIAGRPINLRYIDDREISERRKA
jgi:hypothetical protein